MEFQIKDKKYPLPKGYTEAEIASAKTITTELKKKAPFIKAGLLSRILIDQKSLPLYVYVDDLSKELKQEDIDEYINAAKALIAKHNPNMQLHPMALSEHWQKFHNKDQEYLNVIRFGIVMFDDGFIEPVIHLLAQGRIRPSKEAMGLYYNRAGMTLKNSMQHVLQATLDLYWAVMDAAHAAIMATGKMPPSPSDMAEALELTFVATKQLEPHYPKTMQKFFNLNKSIEHRQITSMDGKTYDANYQEAKKFIARMERLIKARHL